MNVKRTHHLSYGICQVLCTIAQRFNVLLFTSKSFLYVLKVRLKRKKPAGDFPQAFILKREKGEKVTCSSEMPRPRYCGCGAGKRVTLMQSERGPAGAGTDLQVDFHGFLEQVKSAPGRQGWSRRERGSLPHRSRRAGTRLPPSPWGG